MSFFNWCLFLRTCKTRNIDVSLISDTTRLGCHPPFLVMPGLSWFFFGTTIIRFPITKGFRFLFCKEGAKIFAGYLYHIVTHHTSSEEMITPVGKKTPQASTADDSRTTTPTRHLTQQPWTPWSSGRKAAAGQRHKCHRPPRHPNSLHRTTLHKSKHYSNGSPHSNGNKPRRLRYITRRTGGHVKCRRFAHDDPWSLDGSTLTRVFGGVPPPPGFVAPPPGFAPSLTSPSSALPGSTPPTPPPGFVAPPPGFFVVPPPPGFAPLFRSSSDPESESKKGTVTSEHLTLRDTVDDTSFWNKKRPRDEVSPEKQVSLERRTRPRRTRSPETTPLFPESNGLVPNYLFPSEQEFIASIFASRNDNSGDYENASTTASHSPDEHK